MHRSESHSQFYIGGKQASPGTADLYVKSFSAVAGNGLPDLDEGIASSLLSFHDLVPGADQVVVGVVGQQAPGEIELHRNQGQGMAKEVVQIACDALALRFLGQACDLGICALENGIGS